MPTDLLVTVIAGAVALWVALSCAVALVIGGAIRIADDRDSPASSL
ncbi:hypothetical protein [Williamsia serinedens]|nr:hypothetical protein [Williamsia serinedens]